MKNKSLRKQFLSHSAIVTFVVMLVSTVVVDFSYRNELNSSTHERLRLHIYTLLSVAEQSPAGLTLPTVLTNPQFNEDQSTLWAFVANANGEPLWQSLSVQTLPNNMVFEQKTGHWQLSTIAHESRVFSLLSYKIAWERGQQLDEYFFVVAEDEQIYLADLADFRRWLFGASVAVTMVLLLFQYLVLRQSFRPIAELAEEINLLERGAQSHIEKSYPKELEGVCNNLNAHIEKEHRQRQKYRASMADLAHSLKTPLAVVYGELASHKQSDTLQSALVRMNNCIEYQLRRAVSSGHTLLHQGTCVRKAIDDLVKVFERANVDSPKYICLDVGPEVCFRGDENDLIEILGNLLDNAYKYAKSIIHIEAREAGGQFELIVEDDGAGIPASQAEKMLTRGMRLDSQGLGQGIGLAIVADIVNSYGGDIQISRSSFGGASFSIIFKYQEQDL